MIILAFHETRIAIMTEQDNDTSLDWTKCILCQESTSEPLQCPANSRRSDIECGTGYHSLAANIVQFSEIDSLLIHINIKKLDEGNGIAQTLMQRSAKWHKTCRDKFSTMKLKREKVRKNLALLKVPNLQEHALAQVLPKVKRAAFSAEVPRPKHFMRLRPLI